MKILKSYKIMITGYSGFFGKHLLPEIKKKYKNKLILVNSKNANLESAEQTARLFYKVKPDIVINLAAYSGGIGANTNYQADFFLRNIKILTNVFNEAKNFKIKKIINFIGSCSYPEKNVANLRESTFWDGLPVKSSLGYSMSKKMSEILSWTFFQQYKIEYSNYILGNIYGEYDNFKTDQSHVIPALIRKFHEAKLNNKKIVKIWGNGKTIRDFIYAKDAALYVANTLKYNFYTPLNVANGKGSSIKDIVNILANYFKFNGKIEYENSKPQGQNKRILNCTKMNKIFNFKSTNLKTGLFKTAKWFEENYSIKGKIRL